MAESTTSVDAQRVAAPAVAVRLEGLRKSFGDVEAVRGVDLEIADGEFFSMLGPSGSGKTTVLRHDRRLRAPTSGRVRPRGAGRDADPAVRPGRQHRVPGLRPVPAHEPASRTSPTGCGSRGSGGPSARRRAARGAGAGAAAPASAAGARRSCPAASASGWRWPGPSSNQPRVLLLDEPLGALDLKLRQQMQVELKAIQRDVGITFVFVTHDQEEALTMSDRIAVFNAGVIEQVGTATDVYEDPATPFVAGFVGTTNLVDGAAAVQLFGQPGTWSLRPERVRGHRAGRRRRAARTHGRRHGARGRLPRLGRPAARRHPAGDLAGGHPAQPGHGLHPAGRLDGRPVRLLWRREHERRVGAA